MQIMEVKGNKHKRNLVMNYYLWLTNQLELYKNELEYTGQGQKG